jgi:RimJ/RimL family protein N-acetyltransferase
MAGRLTRMREAVGRRGLGGVAREAVSRAGDAIHLHEEHVWYELEVATVPPAEAFAPPLRLVRAEADDLARVEELGRSAVDAREWHADGHDLFLVLDREAVAFSCWNFRGRTPVLAAPGGWLELPGDTVCLEHSITEPTHRGQGIAPRAWMLLANRLADEGKRAMVTKVEVDNAPSRRAVEKAGFREVALQTLDRTGPRRRVRLDVLAPAGTALRERLGG